MPSPCFWTPLTTELRIYRRTWCVLAAHPKVLDTGYHSIWAAWGRLLIVAASSGPPQAMLAVCGALKAHAEGLRG